MRRPLAADEREADEHLASQPADRRGRPARCARSRSAARRASPSRPSPPSPAADPTAPRRTSARTRWAPSCSAHAGSIAATRRAHSRFVSTSSAAITHRGARRVEHRAPGDRERRPAGAASAPGCRRRASRCARAARRARRWWMWSGWPRLVAGADAEVAGGLAQLAEEVLPLPHPEVVEELGAAQPAERRCPTAPAAGVRRWSHRATIDSRSLPGTSKRLCAALAWSSWSSGRSRGSLDRQRGGDHEHLADAVVARRPRGPCGPRRGSTGSRARRRPIGVSRRVAVGRRPPRSRRAPRGGGSRRGSTSGRAARRTGTSRRRRARSPSSAG